MFSSLGSATYLALLAVALFVGGSTSAAAPGFRRLLVILACGACFTSVFAYGTTVVDLP